MFWVNEHRAEKISDFRLEPAATCSCEKAKINELGTSGFKIGQSANECASYSSYDCLGKTNEKLLCYETNGF